MIYYYGSWLVSFSISFFLFIFILIKSKRTITQVLWAFFCLLVSLVSAGFFGAFFSNSEGCGLGFIRLINISSALLPPIFFHFVLSFCETSSNEKDLLFAKVYYFCGFLFAVLLFTPWIVKGVFLKEGLRYWLVPGYLYLTFMICFSVPFLHGYLKMLIFYFKTSSLKRLQVTYVFVATLVGVVGGLTTFIPAFFPSMYPVGTYFLPVYCIIITYAILRHRLLDIEVIIKKTLVFTGVVVAAVCTISLPVSIIQIFVGKVIGLSPIRLTVIGIVTTALIYRPVNRWLTNITDRFLFQKKVNYRLLLKEASEYLAHVDSLKKQTRRIVSFLVNKARIAGASVYVFTSRQPNFLILEAARPIIHDKELNRISILHPIIQCLYKRRSSLELGQLDELKKTEKDPKVYAQFDEIEALFKSLEAEAAVPCFGGQAAIQARKTDVHLRGILFLGHQKSDEPYTEEDLDVFFTLAQESSIAFENARLYDEAVQRAKELKQLNEELEKAQTNLIRAIEELEAINKKLQVTQASLIAAEKKATLVGMAQAIGHEVFNPLSPILMQGPLLSNRDVKNYSYILNKYRNVMESEDVTKFEKTIQRTNAAGQTITRNSKRIEGVVKTLTGTLKASTGEIGSLSVLVLFRRTLESSRFTTGDENLSGCEIELNITQNLMVMGNADQLEGVFLNLIKNAYEAMVGQSNRRIEIRGKVDPGDPKLALIEFADNGPGIPLDIIAKIWMQGFTTKVRKDDSMGAAGQGQGLFVCKHLIESLHRGSITVTSEVGKGTTFIIRLPLA
jgi:signal transduction histidine kinase